VENVSLMTAGFILERSNTPFTVTAGSTMGLNLTVKTPSAQFFGNLSVEADIEAA